MEIIKLYQTLKLIIDNYEGSGKKNKAKLGESTKR